MHKVLLILGLASNAAIAQDWGAKPDQAEAEKIAVEAMNGILKDPYSAHYRWEEIVGTARYEERNGPPCYGWVLLGHVNGRNSYGGYVGERDYRFYIRNGAIDCIVGQQPIGRYGTLTEVRIR